MARAHISSLQQGALYIWLDVRSRPLQRPFLPVQTKIHRRFHRSQHLEKTLVVYASRQNDKSLSQFEREVPPEQRPVNELQELKDSILYSWVRYSCGGRKKIKSRPCLFELLFLCFLAKFYPIFTIPSPKSIPLHHI